VARGVHAETLLRAASAAAAPSARRAIAGREVPGRMGGIAMKKPFVVIVLAVAGLTVSVAGCTDQLYALFASDPATVRVYLVNASTARYVSANLGLCSLGLQTQPHQFITDPPVLAPGEAATFTMRQVGGAYGDCANASPDYMIGLCGWRFGDAPDALTLQDQQYGGQIGVMFHCGDTVILRWTDDGPDCGTWASDVLVAPGNPQPTQDFQLIDAGGSCGG
jgi:hypothetical protein